ncbi:MAG: hypothetical protein ACTH4Y_08015 [Microbacterium gubbeenense]|uniref:hypothetical protein n=1 Tax=Microbacterium gubbeenense TaxID=159896 RepID=UPI003F9D0DFE
MASTDLKLNIDGRIFSGLADGNLFVSRDGLDGWWDSAETRTSEELIPQSHGSQTPASILLGARRVATRVWSDDTTPAAAEEFREWATSLALKPSFEFGVFTADRWLYMRDTSVRGAVKVIPNRNDMRKTAVEFVAWSPDAFKFGPVVSRRITTVPEATFKIHNPGKAPIYPWFKARAIENFRVTSGESGFAYSGNVGTLVTTISPYTGGRAIAAGGTDRTTNITRADWMTVAPGQTATFDFKTEKYGDNAYIEAHHFQGAWV